MPDLESAELEDDVVAIEHDDAALRADARATSSAQPEWWSWLPSTATTGTGEAGACVREDARLLGEAVRREVAGEQDEVDVLRDRRERARQPFAQGLARVDVAGGRDAESFRSHDVSTRREVPRTRKGVYPQRHAVRSARELPLAARDDEAGRRRAA